MEKQEGEEADKFFEIGFIKYLWCFSIIAMAFFVGIILFRFGQAMWHFRPVFGGVNFVDSMWNWALYVLLALVSATVYYPFGKMNNFLIDGLVKKIMLPLSLKIPPAKRVSRMNVGLEELLEVKDLLVIFPIFFILDEKIMKELIENPNNFNISEFFSIHMMVNMFISFMIPFFLMIIIILVYLTFCLINRYTNLR